MGRLLTENRNGLIVDAEAILAGTSQEWIRASACWPIKARDLPKQWVPKKKAGRRVFRLDEVLWTDA